MSKTVEGTGSASVTDSAAAKSMEQLTSQWYNAITSSLSLDTEHFQLAQASEPLLPDTADMWDRFDSVPPKSVAQKYDSSQINELQDEYRSLVYSLQPTGQDTENFRELLGDDYHAWQKYKRNHVEEIGKNGIVSLFQTWATVYLDPAERSKAISYLRRMENDPVSKAQVNVQNPDYFTTFEKYVGQKTLKVTEPNFDKTFDDLKTAVKSGSPETFSFDSETASSNISHTWADGELSGFFSSFFGGAGSSYDEITEKFSDEQLTIDGRFSHVSQFSATPGDWFDASVLKHAFADKNGDIWAEKKWDDYFGSDGSLERLLTTLVVVDGVHFKMESEAEFSEEEQERITGSIETGFWPFFSVTSSFEKDVTHTFDDSGRLTVEFGPTPTGRPQLLGVHVRSIDEL